MTAKSVRALALCTLALALLIAPSAGAAELSGSRWLREHGSLEWVTAAGGWRTSFGAESRATGFEALGGGTELLMGLDLYGPLSLVVDGRFLGGLVAGTRYLETLGALALQFRLSEMVRVRAGPAAGTTEALDASAILVGGFLAGSIDLFALGGRVAAALSLRLDADVSLSAPVRLPSSSMALALGLGVRY